LGYDFVVVRPDTKKSQSTSAKLFDNEGTFRWSRMRLAPGKRAALTAIGV
jgi:hypothetical protein